MHLLSISDLTESRIERIFDLADQLRTGSGERLLDGKTFVLFFPASSIRTRMSFEKGIQALGGVTILFPPETLDKREAMRDVMGYIENEADAVIVRHSDYAKLQELAQHAAIPVVNAMTSRDHPCEILSDLYAIRHIRPNYRELAYTFVGHAGNISRSWMEAAKVLDLRFNHVCVSGQELREEDRNYRFHTNLEAVLPSSDVLLTDSLIGELHTKAYIDAYQITLQRMKMTRPHSLLNPCPPFFCNEEVSEDAIASDYFVGYAFKKSLLYVQQAILLDCLGVDMAKGIRNYSTG